MKTFLIALAALSAVVSAIGQTSDFTPTAASTTARAADLNVLVLDRNHLPVTALTSEAFSLTQDGVPRPIQSLAQADGPVSLCLLIDQSGSTFGIRGPIGQTAEALVKGLPPGSEVMLVHFSDETFLDLPFTPASSVALERLTTLSSRGGTALFDALVKAEINLLANAHQKRRAMVLITDGGDNASRLSGEQAMQRLIRPGAPFLYALTFPDKHDSSDETSRNDRRLKALFKLAGGVVLSARKPEDMTRVADEISAMVRSQYVLSFLPGDPVPDGNMHKLDVRINQADNRDEVHTLNAFYYWEPRSQSTAK